MDHALSIRQSLIASAGGTVKPSPDDQIKAMQQRLTQKRIQAINAMGAKLLNHPGYCYENNPHHSPYVKESATLALIRQQARSEGRI